MSPNTRPVILLFLVLSIVSTSVAQQSMSAADSLSLQVLPATYDRPINPELFLVRPGEIIQVTFLQSSLAPMKLDVSSDGLIVHPSLGIIDVKGLTLAQVREKLTKSLSAQYNVKQTVITVGEPRPIAISVTGAVRTPGFYRVFSSQRVSDVIALAGGVTSDGSSRRIIFSGGPKSIHVDLDKALYLGDDHANPNVYAGYHIDVPVRSTDAVQILGEVLRPREIELLPDDDLNQLLSLAGGMTSNADSSGIRLLGNGTHDIWQPGSIRARDIVQVPRKTGGAEQAFSVLGEVNKPGRFPVASKVTLSEALQSAGGPTNEANINRITIFRIIETDEYAHASRERYPIIAANASFLDTELKPADSVVVPRKLGWVRVSGQVKSPGLFPYVESKDAAFYIFSAGGLLPTADQEHVGLVNRVSHVRRFVSINTQVLDGDEVAALPQVVSAP